MYVLDTDVISKTSPLARLSEDTIAWINERRASSYLSAATLTELHFGLERLNLRGASRKGASLARWIDQVSAYFFGRTLPVGAAVARRAGELLAKAEAAGHMPGFADSFIAATADTLGYEVVTFNARHFEAFGVPFRAPVLDGLRP